MLKTAHIGSNAECVGMFMTQLRESKSLALLVGLHLENLIQQLFVAQFAEQGPIAFVTLDLVKNQVVLKRI
mgnify:CR=1 FL=1